MAELKIGSAVASDLTNAMTDYSVDAQQTDSTTDQKETEFTNTNFSQNLGYYKTIPEIKSVIDAKGTWTVGKGYTSTSPNMELILNSLRMTGKNGFNTFLENMIRTMNIAGDSFAEIIRDDKGKLINLKVMDPSVITVISNRKGEIIRYEQRGQTNNKPEKFKPEEMFHLILNRVADEMHGVSMIDALVPIVLMKNQAMDDWKRVLHRNIDPLWIFHLDTDDPTEIAAFKAKHDSARAAGENMYIPKGVIVPELVATAQNATLNPLAWIDTLDNKFYEAARVPKIIVGGSGEFTEASAKIAYLAFQQTIEEEQLFIEEQVGLQLGIEINLEFPASIENELLSDKKKDGAENIQPNETTAGAGQ